MNILDYIRNILSNNKKNAQIYAVALEKDYNTKDALQIGLYDGKNPIVNTDVTIRINTKEYKRKTDENGIAKLNINLPVGFYTATINFENEEYNNVTAYADVVVMRTDQLSTIVCYSDGAELTFSTESTW